MDQSEIFFDWLPEDDVRDALKIEEQGYPSDEAASLEAFRYRQSLAKELFLGAYISTSTSDSRQLVGYVCSTLSPATSLTHTSMSTHIPNSSSVCIHSVCVAPEYQRKGIGLKLLREYVFRLESARKEKSAPYERVLLITHEELRQFYENAGFDWMGRSGVAHGSKPWYEMRRILGPPSPDSLASSVAKLPPVQVHSQGQQMPPGLWDALQRPPRNRPISRPFSSFTGGISDLILTEAAVSSNRYDILCPRADCGSIILKQGVGKLVERASVQMEPADRPPNPLLPNPPTPPATAQWWLITPSPMEFENIGFSRPVQSPNSGKTTMKLLACAECDLGPLGWSEEGGSEFWLLCSRVGYRV